MKYPCVRAQNFTGNSFIVSECQVISFLLNKVVDGGIRLLQVHAFLFTFYIQAGCKVATEQRFR